MERYRWEIDPDRFSWRGIESNERVASMAFQDGRIYQMKRLFVPQTEMYQQWDNNRHGYISKSSGCSLNITVEATDRPPRSAILIQ